jgi:D-glycerate 3-kinase
VELLGDWIGRGRPDGHPPLIGVAGSQGSGKTTLCRAAVERFGAAHFSIDDVYRSRAEREAMARDIHPLFAVRGPPGTHDLARARRTIEALQTAGPDQTTRVPAFDKRTDDRLPEAAWPEIVGRPSAVLVDGWLLGATPIPEAELAAPVNALEAEEDPDGVWRRHWNGLLAGEYARWFATFDAMLFLAAPSFAVVLDWRSEQEAGLIGVEPQDLPSEGRVRLARFVAHYQRLTEQMLSGGVRADAIANLADDRKVLSIRRRRAPGVIA